jgi:hypothetical protein
MRKDIQDFLIKNDFMEKCKTCGTFRTIGDIWILKDKSHICTDCFKKLTPEELKPRCDIVCWIERNNMGKETCFQGKCADPDCKLYPFNEGEHIPVQQMRLF